MELFNKKDFLSLNESRSTELSEEDAIKLLKKNCDIDYCLKYPIYRGTTDNKEFKFIDPKLHNRTSANTANYYTMILDNSPLWVDFPERSQSIICSTYNYYAGSFGTKYRVFPYKEAKFGICPNMDFWNCFAKVTKKLDNIDSLDLGDFNTYLEDEYHLTRKDSYEEIKTKLQAANIWDIITKEILIPDQRPDYFLSLDYYGKDMQSLFDNNKISNNEIWTDSKCILVKSDNLTYILDNI